MKSINKYINILNIISVVFILISTLIQDFIIYEQTLNIILIMYYVIGGLNIIIAIINFVKKNKKIGILQLITGIIMISGMAISMVESSFYMFLFAGVITIGLSIFNIVINRKLEQKKKSKIVLISFILILIINAYALVVPIIKNMININNLGQALSKIEQDEELGTYVFKKGNKYIFIDENGNKVSENDYDEISTYTEQLKIQDKTITVRCAKKGNKIYIINSKGEKLFELCNDMLGELVDKKWNADYIFSFFWSYIVENEVFEISEDDTYLGFEEYKENENVLNKYNEDMSQYEDSESEDIEYKYFQNKEFSENILQVVINKSKIEEDEKLEKSFLKSSSILSAHSSNSQQTMDIYDLIQEFYPYEKEYYLINPNDNTKKQLECNNLIYQAYYDINNELKENILVYESGEIPYYDIEESGYFTLDGEKNNINNKYLVQEITEKYIIIINTDTKESLVFDKQTNELLAEYESLSIYKNFYVSYEKDIDASIEEQIATGEYEILDKEFNKIIEYKSSREPVIYKENMIMCMESQPNYITGVYKYCYFYDGEKFNLLEDMGEFEFEFMNNKYNTSGLIYNFDNSIYSKIGVISSYEMTN